MKNVKEPFDASKEPTSSKNVFDLQGRRLSEKPARGMYIQNGKKYVVK